MFDPERADKQPVAPVEPDLPLDGAGAARTTSSRHVPGTGRRPFATASSRQRAVVVTVAVLATTLVAGLLAWNGGRSADGSVAAASHPGASASTTGATTGSASPSPTGSTGPGPSFEPLTGTSAKPAALLTARGAIGAIVPLDAGFRLESADGTPASTLAARLTVEPAFAFTTTKESGDRAVLLAPSKPLAAGSVYRFSLRGEAGQLLDTWAFQAKQPLRIVGTLPETRTAEVPLDTGIEVTFDQDGVTDAAAHLSIEPATAGRFEMHGRTLAFIPDRPLTPSTVYSVTVTRGIKVAATDEATVVDTRIQFETAARSDSGDPRTFEFPDEVVESPTSERPTIGIWTYGGGETKAPTTTRIVVYRLPTLDAAIGAYRSLRARPDWTRWSSTGLVDVARLSQVLSADLPLNAFQNGFWVRLPEPLPAGWYLVQQADGSKPIQAVLQVTDVAGYLAASGTRTVVWANDIASGRPLAGATVSSDGVRFGRTDERGLALAATPNSLLPRAGESCANPCDPVAVVRTADGRQVFLPVSSGRDKLDGYGGTYWWSEADSATWTLLHTDRSRYRPGDTVNVWGYARDRDSGAVPSEVTIRLDASSDDGLGSGAPAVRTLTRRPDRAGAFHGSLALTGLPDGSYTMTLSVGKRVIRSTSIVIGQIAKPAYQLHVTSGRRIYIAGDQVKVTVEARFFEGTPVPGVPLRIDGFADGQAVTDSLGTAVWRTTARIDEEDSEGPVSAVISALPARAEEAEITAGSRDVVIFPSSRTIDAIATIADGKVVASGGLHLVAVNRLEAAIAKGQSFWELDARGKAVANATVSVRFTELVPTRRLDRTEYDFIEKKVVPIYEYDVREVAAGTIRVTTRADGSWSASVPASKSDHTYRIQASAGDPDGHVARSSTSASRTLRNPYEQYSFASLDLSAPAANPSNEFGTGERIDVRFTDPNRAQTAGDGTRYLFFTAQRGIRSATVQSSRRYQSTFPTWGAPNLSIGGVRFTGSGYVGTVWFGASFRAADRRIAVELTTDAPRYVPGQTVTVDVRTRAAGGAPVSATVILRAVDEKLFTIGAAAAEDPLAELYAGIDNGVIDTYRSHRTPEGQPEGGDTTGGGGDDRDDFRDSLLFEAITTGSDGRGRVSFELSDDLTSWRVTAAAVTRGLQAGVGSVHVPVGLPFFVDASIAPEYLTADRPTIAVRTFGSALAADAPVTIRVTSASLGFDSGPLASDAFTTIDVPLPALRAGTQTISISATTGSGRAARTDRLTRTFQVVDTRLSRQRTSYVELPASSAFRGGDGFTTVLVADASGGRYLALLSELAGGSGARLDRTLAADLATSLLEDRFGVEPGDPTREPLAIERHLARDGGLALVPYSSSDLELSALVAIVAPDRIDRAQLAMYLRAIRADAEETRERRLYALAGLAGLGEPLLPAIATAAADPALTVREQLLLGLGAASLGDAATARRLLDDLVTASGEQAGTLARLRVGSSTAEITEGTALAAVLAAAVGSPLGPRFWAYVEQNPASDRIEVLPAIAFVTHTLARQPVQPARFAWTVAGTRTVVSLGTGESLRLDLTPTQLATLSIERLAGIVGMTTQWRENVGPSAFTADPDLTMTRSVLPAGPVKAADLVIVELHVSFSAQAGSGCRQVTELVPSGLAPIGAGSRWFDPDLGVPLEDDGVVLPYDQAGSRVSFCVEPSSTRRAFTLRYVARVVTPGTYAWEPAVAQSITAEAIANLTPAASITIR